MAVQVARARWSVAPIRTFYVNPAAADDTGAGTSPATAWKTLTKVNSTTFLPGDALLFARGGTWTGTLTFTESGTAGNKITLGAWGSGARPIIDANNTDASTIDITGSDYFVQDLDIRNAGVANSGNERANVRVSAATRVTVRRCRIAGGTVGVVILDSPSCRVTECVLDSNNKMVVNTAGGNDDYGAQAISIGRSDDCEVDHNTSTGHVATSVEYGFDGQFCEVFNANRTHIHRNVVTDDLGFVEIGQTGSFTADDTWIHHNQVVAAASVGGGTATGLVTRGSSDFFGPTYRTVFEHNTVNLKGTDANSTAVGIAGTGGTDYVVRCRNNIIVAGNNTIYVGDVTLLQESYNQLNGGDNITPGTGSITTTATFVSGTDYHLLSTSPARNAGLAGLGYAADLDGVPIVGTPDMGCYEYPS